MRRISIFTGLVMLILVVVTFAGGQAQAQRLTVSGDSLFLTQRSNVRVQPVASEADFNNVFGIQSPINQDLFRCQREVPIGFVLDTGNRERGELEFRLITPEGRTYRTGPGNRNPDGKVHVRYQVISPDQVRIAWEDLFNLGDADFNDCTVDIVASKEVPDPPSIRLLPPDPRRRPPREIVEGLQATPRVFINEKDTPGLPNADRQLVLSIAVENNVSAPRTLVVCPMLHVHDPASPDPGEPVMLQELIITPTGGQRPGGISPHGGRTFRFPFPRPTPLTVGANRTVLINYPVKLSEFVPPGLENLTRAEIERKIINHQMDRVDGLSSLYVDIFFDFNLDPGDVFQCPHGANTAWAFGIDDPDDFTVGYVWYNFTVTNAFSTLTVPLTTHTSETERGVLDGSPLSAFIEVIPNCFLVECPSSPGTGGTSGLPTVVWTTEPAPGETFVIDELEEAGKMTLDFPSPMPDGAVVAFTVIMKEADSGRLLSGEAKRFAQDTTSPAILGFDFAGDGEGNLFASATVHDEAASIDFVELLVSRDGGQSFTGFPMDWKRGDFLTPTVFEATFGPVEPGKTIVKIRVVDEAGNSSETPPREVGAGLPVCDIDGDSDVDRTDIEAIFAARNTPVRIGDPRDADNDGTITVNDARICTLRCTKPNCAP